jgi:hypothetical protein
MNRVSTRVRSQKIVIIFLIPPCLPCPPCPLPLCPSAPLPPTSPLAGAELPSLTHYHEGLPQKPIGYQE